MIQVDVGQKESVEITDAQTVYSQLFTEIGNRRRRTGINQSDTVAPVKQCCGNGAGMAGPVQIERDCGCHKQGSLA